MTASGQDGFPEAGEGRRFGETGESAEQILRVARQSLAPINYDLTGIMRPGGISFKKVPFKLTMFEKSLRFRFHKDDKSKNPFDLTITLDLKDNRYQMFETPFGQEKKELPLERYGERIRGTDVTFEDIALRFLYWPDPKRLPDEKIMRPTKRRDSCVIECRNPIESGPYRKVLAWIDKQSGALLKIEGYGRTGKMVKQFYVRDVQRAGKGEWVLEKVRVTTFDPDSGKQKSETYMEFDKPKKK